MLQSLNFLLACAILTEYLAKAAVADARNNTSSGKFLVHHSTSYPQARRALRAMNLKDIELEPECSCTKEDVDYCTSKKVIEDHCCCDLPTGAEQFPYVPHTCYIGLEKCTISKGDCAEYIREVDCCCRKITAQHWSERMSAGTTARLAQPLLLVIALKLV